ncbi:UxaA family hydrolase [Haladaptatus salinisoli]|uniref:UxaA family hydrolase n=1 Tax=Haladaptatus salinisoli TaxID=2884876 RepID=UPI001D0BA268|nr:UxaA family hydrolase [Haladaptatus salinisoli]
MTTDAFTEETELNEETFIGYRRSDGRLGTRNRVLVLPSVICSHLVAEEVAARADRAVVAPHDHGCAQLGADNDQTKETFLGVGSNPNIAGTVVVGLGCEHVQSDSVAAALSSRNLPVREIAIQDAGGTEPCIKQGIEAVSDLGEHIEAATRTRSSLGDLTVGIVSSDLGESTMREADPLVGEFARAVIKAGGRVIVAGNERFTAHPKETCAAADGDTTLDVEAFLQRHQNLPARATRVYSKARECDFKDCTRFCGSLPIREIVSYGEVATHDQGLAIVDAPSRFEEAATGLAAAGAQIVLHVTGEGIPTGHPIVPVLKVSANEDTLAALPDDIDIDASAITSTDLAERVLTVANGEKTCSERHGITEFAITRVGPSM